MNTLETLQAVINTLNQVSVSGYENLNRLLGSIQTLDKLKNELKTQDEKKTDKSEG